MILITGATGTLGSEVAKRLSTQGRPARALLRATYAKWRRTSSHKTKVQMEQVMDSARRVNQVVGKGSNDGQAQRLWTALRASINDLARCYNLTPMGA